jgi:hypothetical protein
MRRYLVIVAVVAMGSGVARADVDPAEREAYERAGRSSSCSGVPVAADVLVDLVGSEPAACDVVAAHPVR